MSGVPDGPVIVPVTVARLRELLPLDPYASPAWDCKPFTVADVLACSDPDPGDFDSWSEQGTRLHIAHVAHLVRAWPNDGTAAPVLYVCRGVTLCDGWHRFAAAIARADECLYVELCGDLREALDHGIPFRRSKPA